MPIIFEIYVGIYNHNKLKSRNHVLQRATSLIYFKLQTIQEYYYYDRSLGVIGA